METASSHFFDCDSSDIVARVFWNVMNYDKVNPSSETFSLT